MKQNWNPLVADFFAANGTNINVVREIILNVHVRDLTIPTRFMISNNVTEPMLGVNLGFFQRFVNCLWTNV